MITTNWNHSTKPSMFEIKKNGVVVFSGPFNEGMNKFKKMNDLTKEPEDCFAEKIILPIWYFDSLLETIRDLVLENEKLDKHLNPTHE